MTHLKKKRINRVNSYIEEMKQEWKTQVTTMEHLHSFINKLSEMAGSQKHYTL